jgi:KaiC/GvpD/RAD55 family RecA-like ATPase
LWYNYWCIYQLGRRYTIHTPRRVRHLAEQWRGNEKKENCNCDSGYDHRGFETAHKIQQCSKIQLVIENIFESRSEIIEQTRYGFKPEILDIEIPSMVELIHEGTDCLVVDNIGTFALRVSTKKLRDQFDGLNYLVRKKGCTALLMMDESAHNLTHQLAEYSVYGSIRLLVKENSYLGKMERYMYILKMRSTPISPEMSVFEITSEGIKIRESGGESPGE